MKFSIIVLSYNCEKTIQAALDSALFQTHNDIEVICVDDCSADNTSELISRYGKYSNFTLIENSRNLSASVSRRIGMEKASGDYVLFLDGDDILCSDACEVLASKLKNHPCDILYFYCGLEYSDNTPPAERRTLDGYLNNFDEKISGEAIIEAYFKKRTVPYTIWNKCYSIELIRKIAANTPDAYININDDLLFSIIACKFATSLRTITNRLYNYRIGAGISTSKTMSLDKYTSYVRSCASLSTCIDVANELSAPAYVMQSIALQKKRCIISAYLKLKNLPSEMYSAAGKVIFETFDVNDVILALIENNLYCSQDVAKYIDLKNIYPFTRDKVRTVGIFYHRLYNGGVERVIGLLSSILVKSGYKVVVITDEPESSKDFPLDDGVIREVISGTIPYTVPEFKGRSEKLIGIIEKYGIDAVIYNAWVSLSLFWDMLAIKSTGAAFINYCHGTFITSLNQGDSIVYNTHLINRHADAIITLSSADHFYWSRFNSNTFKVVNPSTFSVATTQPSPLSTHRIIWLGRADSPDKNPMDAMIILQRVMEKIPDAVLCMVGQITSQCRTKYEELINELGIAGHIEFAGYNTDVKPFFASSSVLLQTSNFESYCMTMIESLSCGVPVVAYEMPYLTICRDSKAIIQTPWKDIDAAADSLVKLLSDETLRKEMGVQARIEAEKIESVDQASLWKNILDSLSDTNREPSDFSVDMKTINEAMDEYSIVVRQMCSTIKGGSRAIGGVTFGGYSDEQVTTFRQEIYDSKRYRLGKLLLFIPSKLWTAVSILFRHGPTYMLKVAKDKLQHKTARV